MRGALGRFVGAFGLGLTIMLAQAAGNQASAIGSAQAGAPAPGPPNILFVLCDDLGFGDLGVLFQNDREESRRHATPQMDRLAAQGRILMRHYCPAPVCAPSRASLMLGQHQGHAGIRNNQFDKALPRDHSLASVLREAGYRTALIGKWGLQGKGKGPEDWASYPMKVGFEEFFGYVRHRDGHSHYPAHTTKARGPMELYDGVDEVSAQLTGCYTADLFTARAKRFLKERADDSDGEPFFLLLSYDTPHAALHVPTMAYPEGGGVEGGVQWLGHSERMINTAAEPIDVFLHPDYADQDWTDSEKRFATMVRRLDSCLGDLMQTLEDLGQAENTILVLTSDNGPHKEAYTPGRRYGADRFDSFGPLDGIKRDVYEGGIRVPTVVRWPRSVPGGTRSQRPSQFHDWLATFAEVAGVPVPPSSDGVSLVADLKGEPTAEASSVYVEYAAGGATPKYEQFAPGRRGAKRGQMQAIYLEGYKGVRTQIQGPDDPFQIYDTRIDPGEERDLAQSGEAFLALSQHMQDAVLRMRRSDASAPRPYDQVPMPALAHQATAPGWDRASSPGDYQRHSGWIDVPKSGEWTFHLQAPRGSVLRLHDALVIDDDFERAPGWSQGSVWLEAGLHPIAAYVGGAATGAPLILEWEGPSTERQSVGADRRVHPAPRKDAALGPVFEAAARRQELVGIAAGVVTRDEITELYFGFENAEAGIPVTAATRFRWASISKPVTAIAAMQLVEEGRLDLDRDVREYVPEFPDKGAPITARQLMQHRGGIVHYSNGKVVPTTGVDYGTEHPFADVVLALDRFKDSPLISAPGARHAYTTHGYMLLGAVVQRAGGAPFHGQVQQRIAGPLGLLTLRPDYEWEAIPHRAAGYRRLGKMARPSGSSDVSWKLPGGGYLSTVGDLALFAQAVARQDLLKESSWVEMCTPQSAPETSEGVIGYGLGLGLRKTKRGLRVAHSGAQQKTRTLMQVYPGSGRALVLMTNSEWAQLNSIADELWDALDEQAKAANQPR